MSQTGQTAKSWQQPFMSASDLIPDSPAEHDFRISDCRTMAQRHHGISEFSHCDRFDPCEAIKKLGLVNEITPESQGYRAF